jgi:hypothetical protein
VSYEVRPQDVIVVDGPGRGTLPPPVSGPAGWLRRNRLRIGLSLAAFETLLLLVRVVHVLPFVLIAVAVIALYVRFGRRARSALVRELALIVTIGQALPLVAAAIGAVLVVSVAIALVVLLTGLVLLVLFQRRTR